MTFLSPVSAEAMESAPGRNLNPQLRLRPGPRFAPHNGSAGVFCARMPGRRRGAGKRKPASVAGGGFKVVAQPGIEPGTRGFSVLCSTN